MTSLVSVAIPTRNAGPTFAQTLQTIAAQRVDRDVELVICDSASSDGTVEMARAHDAEVISIDPHDFSHGGTRNMLMQRSQGEHVAFLTQDAVPGDPDWLAGLLAGFELHSQVGLVFGPYRPRPEAPPIIARALSEWFASLTLDGDPRVDWLPPSERRQSPAGFHGPLGYFTDANGCVARDAWREVPFRTVAYAEDHFLAQDMLRRGFAKVYMPDAAVLHSHEYTLVGWLRRSFDEARAMRDVYAWVAPRDPRVQLLQIWGLLKADLRWGRTLVRPSPSATARLAAESFAHHLAVAVGTVLGGRAEQLPPAAVRHLSLERRLR